MLQTESDDIKVRARHLLELIKKLINEEHYNGVQLLFTSRSMAVSNLACVSEISMELLNDVCLCHLNDRIYETNPSLYICAEELLRIIATHGPEEELILELLDIVEEQQSEYVFSSALKALEIVLLRMDGKKYGAFDWCLNSIIVHLNKLPLPRFLMEDCNNKQQRLFEQNKEVQDLLTFYVTVELFYKPLLQKIKKEEGTPTEIFRTFDFSKRNILCCFLLRLLGKPLSLLDLESGEEKTNMYTIQCAHNLTKSVSECLINPFRIFYLTKRLVRWKHIKNEYWKNPKNIFYNRDKITLDALAIYFYMVFVEEVDIDRVPKIYSPYFVLEIGTYLATELLNNDEPALHYRALCIIRYCLQSLRSNKISSINLELEVHRNFCCALCNIIGYSSETKLRQNGIKVLREYILQFDDEGKYIIIKNLLRTVHHTGISGYLAILYKDFVGDALKSEAPLPPAFSGKNFQSIFLQSICKLPEGPKTDLIEHSDEVICSLNTLRFFALNDVNNRTGFWNFISNIDRQFIDPFHEALDISVAHYKLELQSVENDLMTSKKPKTDEQLQLIDISVANSNKNIDVGLELTQQERVEILNRNLCTFDLMRSLLARLRECIDNFRKFVNIEKNK